MTLTRRIPKTSKRHLFEHRGIDYFCMDAIPDNVLMIRGKSNNNTSVKIPGIDSIADGSVIVVHEGQAAVAVENGKVTEIYDSPGEHVFESKCKEQPVVQRIYYINRREIRAGSFSFDKTTEVSKLDPATGRNMEIVISCRGELSYRIIEPVKFVETLNTEFTDTLSRTEYNREIQNELMEVAASVAAGLVESGKLEPSSQLADYSELDSLIPTHLNDFYGGKFDEIWSNRGMSTAAVLYTRINCYKVTNPGEKKLDLAAALLEKVWTCGCGSINKGKFCTNCGQKKM